MPDPTQVEHISGAPLYPQTRLERPVRAKHFSLFGALVSYKEKYFVNAVNVLPVWISG